MILILLLHSTHLFPMYMCDITDTQGSLFVDALRYPFFLEHCSSVQKKSTRGFPMSSGTRGENLVIFWHNNISFMVFKDTFTLVFLDTDRLITFTKMHVVQLTTTTLQPCYNLSRNICSTLLQKQDRSILTRARQKSTHTEAHGEHKKSPFH